MVVAMSDLAELRIENPLLLIFKAPALPTLPQQSLWGVAQAGDVDEDERRPWR